MYRRGFYPVFLVKKTIKTFYLFRLSPPAPPLSFCFFCLASNAFPDIGSVGRIEKKNLKKILKESRNRRPWYPKMTLKVNIHIFGLTKWTIYCKNRSCFCSCFSLCCYVTMLIFQIKVFRYSFSEAIPIFFHLLKSGFSLSDPL